MVKDKLLEIINDIRDKKVPYFIPIITVYMHLGRNDCIVGYHGTISEEIIDYYKSLGFDITIINSRTIKITW